MIEYNLITSIFQVWCFICSLFYEKEGFYCKPIELPEKEFGGVAVALGQKVRFLFTGISLKQTENIVFHGKCKEKLITTLLFVTLNIK